MIAAVRIALLILLVALGEVSSQSTCLTVTLYDSFGDGWDDAMLFIENPSGSMVQAAPNCTVNPLFMEVCGDHNGDYYFMVLNGNDDPPDNYWEIVYKVEIQQTGEIFTGGFNTTLVLNYDSTDQSWQLIHYQHMWSNSPNATACGSSEYINDGECLPQPSSESDTEADGSGSGKTNPRPKKLMNSDIGYIEKISGSAARAASTQYSVDLVPNHGRKLMHRRPSPKHPTLPPIASDVSASTHSGG
eukprot:CAMPEP_0182428628 /NCGR_PEP_ID=MMETSP1167-20130531/23161_1 /TAXON_ID=2988 /ORGANISM="Mallomonas Sp, Strain CCMP3275" /LENGTH=244 /DNA_ID=CAMNT_0024611621 /DNA_START=86 /DNA_END=816 /DNA_ORIENTATION=+